MIVAFAVARSGHDKHPYTFVLHIGPRCYATIACSVCVLACVQYLKKTMGVAEDDPQKDLKGELKHLFAKLCGKLDALCNFHYTPKAAIPEMKVSKISTSNSLR